MKLLFSFLAGLGLTLSFGFAQESPAEKLLGEVDTTLPGIQLVVTDILRVDASHAVVTVRVRGNEKQTGDSRVEEPPLVPNPPANASPQELDDAKYHTQPFSLLSSVLVDEATGTKYKAMPLPMGMPYRGPSQLRSSLEPGSWIQMSVCFAAPPPLPPGQDGKIPDQKITLLLSRAAKPLTGLLLPGTPTK